MNNVNLIAFGTFGNPNGFTQTFFAGNPIRDIKTFDIRGSILVYPKSKLYSIRKEHKNGQNIISYAVYTYAKEPTSAREGSFIGSGILFVDRIAEENITIKNLNEFHQNLITKNVQNETIIVNHSKDFNVKECKPKDFDKISFNEKNIEDLDFQKTSGKNLLILCRTQDNILQSFFKKSIDLLNVYDNIYFTSNKEIAEFVRQKGILTAVDETSFETEIQKLAEERLRKNREATEEFEREKQSLEENRKKLIEEHKNQIEQNVKQHQENKRRIEESKNELNNINQKYEAYSKKIEESISRLKGGEKLENVRQLHNENKRIFIDSINRQQKPNFLNSISKPNTRTDLRTAPQTLQTGDFSDYNDDERHQRRSRSKGIDIFKVATLVLLLLWIGTMVYFLFFNEPEKETTIINQPQQEQKTIEKDTTNTKQNK